MNILVTGGTGFIGSHTAVVLHQHGFNPIIIDNLSNSDAKVLDGLKQITGVDFRFYEGDCCNAPVVNQIFSDQPIHGVIHFAAYKAVGESVAHPLKYYQNNLGSLSTLLGAMLAHQCPHLIFSSSCTVYGQPDALPVTENTPKKPAESPYGNTKQISEEIIEDFVKANPDYRAIALRYFNPIGAHPSAIIGELPLGTPNNLVPFITQTAIGKRDSLTIFGDDYKTPDGTCIRDYIHVMDLAEAHVAALRHLAKPEAAPFDIINAGTGQGNTVMEVVKCFEETNDLSFNYKMGPRRPGDVEQVYADVSKAETLLGWKTQYSLQDALKHAWNWEKKLADRC